ncbi:MAG: hypothetical protein GC139_04355 [Sideroxydans sp.]|nr:hypothetical protein [Sideroxydans sp.]
MNNNKLMSRIPTHYRGYFALALWASLTLLLLRHDPYGLNEGAAKALLLTWSIADQVASSVVTFGTPDLRTLLFLPTGFLWTGNIFAAKVLTILLLAMTAWLLYCWKRQSTDAESALLATGLLIISPAVLTQIDALAPGVYLLAAFATGAWIDKTYRANPKSFGGWYFAQLFICAFSVSLHPAGLAYPLILLWSWRTEPLDLKQQKYFLIGISFTVLLMLIISMGWAGLEWLQNPIASLGEILLPNHAIHADDGASYRIATGIVMLLLLAFVIIKQWRSILAEFIGRTFLGALAIGLLLGDQAWSLIGLCIILYYGLPLLLRNNQSAGFVQQRGAALLLILVFSTLFMHADRNHYEMHKNGALSAQDDLIKAMAEKAEDARRAAQDEGGNRKIERIRVASQWPSRTMIACKCDTLPLPPAAKDPSAQLNMLHGITHLLLDPKKTENLALARNLSLLGNAMETTSLQPGGVILHIQHSNENAGTPEK